MNEFLNDMPLLIEVARQKSFTKASEILGIGASTLSRRIKQLEEKMGTPLFFRDTRNVELTPTGAFLLDRCEFILAETQKVYNSVTLDMREPSGLIRICMFADTYSHFMKNTLSDFAAKWPKIQMTLTFVEHAVDMRTSPYDVAFLIGPSIASPLVSRKLFTIEPFLYASPRFLERYPKPTVPQDLYSLPCITLDRVGNRWTLDKGDQQVTLEIEPHYIFSSSELCREFTLAGHGVALLRKGLALADEKAGRLLRLLPEWRGYKHAPRSGQSGRR